MPRPRKDASQEPSEQAPVKGRPSIGRQVNVRIPADLLVHLEEISAGMGLDLSNTIRMILTENHDDYLQRVRGRKANP